MSRMLERPIGRSGWHRCKGVPPSSFLNGGVAARCWAPYTYPSHSGEYGNVTYFGVQPAGTVPVRTVPVR